MAAETDVSNQPLQSSFAVRAQYIKDLSFENPNAPQSLTVQTERPQLDVNVDLTAGNLQENLFEVSLHIVAKASTPKGPLFLADLVYGGVFELAGVPEARLSSMLLIDCPFVLFPFARRVIADVTRDGGFPPLLLDPIDFHGLYLKNRE